MYENKTLICKDCGNEFDFTAGEQEFYAEKALPMSHNAANLAVMQENKQETMQAELQENYLKLHVPNVAAHVKFHFSLATIVLFTAVIALQTKDKCASLLEKLLDSFSHPLGVFL